MRSRVGNRELLAEELRAALGSGAVAVHYQPCIDLRTGNVLAVEASEFSLAVNYDHVHSYNWFSEENLAANGPGQREVWNAVTAELVVDRHQGNTANYLYVDGHVEVISADQIGKWCDEGFNFAIPPEFR